MNPIILSALKLMLPLLEQAGLKEWSDVGYPALMGVAKHLELGKGQEEAVILINALDQIMKFEASRSV